jgi:hypothetical protein
MDEKLIKLVPKCEELYYMGNKKYMTVSGRKTSGDK